MRVIGVLAPQGVNLGVDFDDIALVPVRTAMQMLNRRSLFRILVQVQATADTDIAKLCKPFEQVENQFSKSHQGSGLGLAISRALVELHGGSLKIKSREGQGTTVTCLLPSRAVAADDTPVAKARSAESV